MQEGIKKPLGDICTILQINCVVNDVKITAIVATSYNSTYMSEKCASKCNIKHLMETSSSSGSSSSGSRSDSKNKLQPLRWISSGSIRIKNRNISATFTIMNFCTDLILGADFLRQHHCTIDMLHNNMIIGTCDVETHLVTNRDMFKGKRTLTNRVTAKEYYPRTLKGMLLIDCSVNGQSVRALLDTGSSRSFLSESFAEQAGLMEVVDLSHSSIEHGAGSKKNIGRIHCCPFNTKDTHFKHWKFDVVEDPFPDVLLGLDFLHDSTIDIHNNKLIIGDTVNNIIMQRIPEKDASSNSQRKKTLPNKEKIHASIKAAREEGTKFSCTFSHRYINCCVNGVMVNAMVDTGAETTSISAAFARQCGVLDLLDQQDVRILRGFGKQRSLGSIHLFPIEVNGDILHVTLVVKETPFNMIIGLDILSPYNYTIDLKEDKLVMANTGTKSDLIQVGPASCRFHQLLLFFLLFEFFFYISNRIRMGALPLFLLPFFFIFLFFFSNVSRVPLVCMFSSYIVALIMSCVVVT